MTHVVTSLAVPVRRSNTAGRTGRMGRCLSAWPRSPRDLVHRGDRVRRAEHRGARDERGRAGCGARSCRLGVDAAVDLDRHARAEQPAQALELARARPGGTPGRPSPGSRSCRAARSMSASELGSGGDRRGRAQREPGAAARRVDRLQRVVHVRGRLGVDGDGVRARLARTSSIVALRALDHQVHVDRSRRRRGPGRRAPRRRAAPIVIGGTKWPSITSTWIDRRAGVDHRRDLLAQAREVGREDRGRDAVEAAPSDRLEHRAPAVVAHVERGVGHPHDRGVLAAVRAHREQLEAVQAVHAAVAARAGSSDAAMARGRSGRRRRGRRLRSLLMSAAAVR